MTRIFSANAGRIQFKNPTTGYVALDTARPMPAKIGTFAVNNVGLTFPKVPGEQSHGEYASGDIRYWMTYPLANLAGTIDLGAFTGSVLPSMTYGLINIQRTAQGGNVTGLIELCHAQNEWLQWPGGSLLLEVFGQGGSAIHLWRHIDISIVSGRWKLNWRQGNRAITTAKTYSPITFSTSSSFSLDLRLEWDVFK